MTQYRQGDVLLVACDHDHPDFRWARPSSRDERNRLVLAWGEATGHAHAIHEPNAELVWATSDSLGLLTLPSGGRLVHEEHDPIDLPPGTWRVVRQREYTGPRQFTTVAD